MLPLSIGLSGLTASQRLLDLTGTNIANAGTPGFHRREAVLVPQEVGAPYGTGVEVARVRRLVSTLLEQSVTRNTSTTADVSRQLDGMQQVESLLQTGDGSLPDLLEKFFNQAQQLTAAPQDLTQRRQLLATAGTLAGQLNATTDALARLRDDLRTEAGTLVDQVNSLTGQIAQLNDAIKNSIARDGPTADLEDRRDDLINQLAGIADVRVIDQDLGQKNVLVGGMPLVVGTRSATVSLKVDANDRLSINFDPLQSPLTLTGGSLAGVLTLRNQTLPELRGQFDTFATELIRSLDPVVARGVGLTGPMTFVDGQRAATSTTAPLAQAGLSYPPTAGSLFVSVTDVATGQRTLHEVAIDPATQSLQDVAAALSSVPNLQAVVDAQTGTLKLMAAPGFAFDFAGQLPTHPDTAGFTGTAVPQIGGTYTGSANDDLTFKVVGTGTVGAGSLTLEVRNAAGTLVNSFNVGQGYEPGSALTTPGGVEVRLGAGTVNDGDTFSVRTVADPDTAGLLTALGLNTLFVGDDASGIAVRPDLLAAPERLGLAGSANPGDSTNVVRLVQLRDDKRFASGTQTFGEYLTALVTRTGGQVQDLQLRKDAQESLGTQLAEQQQAVSGVDPNEELARLVQYQRSFQMCARYMSVVNDTLDELFRIV
jgi:flagellar hook-associated protein FlgK